MVDSNMDGIGGTGGMGGAADGGAVIIFGVASLSTETLLARLRYRDMDLEIELAVAEDVDTGASSPAMGQGGPSSFVSTITLLGMLETLFPRRVRYLENFAGCGSASPSSCRDIVGNTWSHRPFNCLGGGVVDKAKSDNIRSRSSFKKGDR